MALAASAAVFGGQDLTILTLLGSVFVLISVLAVALENRRAGSGQAEKKKEEEER